MAKGSISRPVVVHGRVQLKYNTLVNDEWIVGSLLGTGGFANVYQVKNKDGVFFAMKTEVYDMKSVLKMEVFALQKIAEKPKIKHFLLIAENGTGVAKCPVSDRWFVYMVTALAGPSLDALRRARADKRFTMGCALSLGVQCVQAIRELHSVGFLHRDIKGSNLAIGRADTSARVYLLDLGMCRQFRDENGVLKVPRRTAVFRGTSRYAPLSSHLLREFSRKDDLESWLYQQIEFTNGSLPWNEAPSLTDVALQKERCRYGVFLREMMVDCPTAYIDILKYVDSLGYYDEPDYKKIISLLKSAMNAFKFKEEYDWIHH